MTLPILGTALVLLWVHVLWRRTQRIEARRKLLLALFELWPQDALRECFYSRCPSIGMLPRDGSWVQLGRDTPRPFQICLAVKR